MNSNPRKKASKGRKQQRDKPTKKWPDSERVVDDNGEEWRLCAAAVVFNTDGDVLVGERVGKDRGSWQLPQGGVDLGESVVEAASREGDDG
jgi:putative (di)nucleoside polyphosphate hydrolase